ncbi:hypothetical protein ACFE04_004424 [Oxalis oulophora]
MEYPFSSKETGIGHWAASPRTEAENLVSPDIEGRNLGSEDLLSFSELLSFDSFAGWDNSSSPALTDHTHATYGLSNEALTISENDLTCGDKSVLESSDNLFDNATCSQNDISDSNHMLFKAPSLSLNDKMLRALSLFRESSEIGILAQVWVPMKQGDKYTLSTCEQPYLLDQMLAGYREVSRMFTFSAEEKSGLPLGLPGRVFVSKVPEWTSNIGYYSMDEYVRGKYAVDHEVRGSIALPIFEPHDLSRNSCCAVLELVSVKEKPNFDLEMENVIHSLQAVNLSSTAPLRLLPRCLSSNQRAALAEISNMLRSLSHAHTLPLALTWIPCSLTEGPEKPVLCIEDTACYVNDKKMQGFVHACTENHIEEGQGLAGKALQSNYPFFFADVKTYDITEYPLVHHARKFGLNAAVAIRLRSIYTGDDDYILEFFLPINMKGSAEQQFLLNNLSGTMQRLCKSLRTVSNEELSRAGYKVGFQNRTVPILASPGMPKSFQATMPGIQLNIFDKVPLNVCPPEAIQREADSPHEQVIGGSTEQLEKKRSTGEKNVSLSVLQQYFSGSLKDAAKSIGVCPTTLKRICRQHGITRWPSRKINKVNRSLRKIQTVIDSVHGVAGGLKFDSKLMAGGSVISLDNSEVSFMSQKSSPLTEPVRNSNRDDDDENSAIKLENNKCHAGGNQVGPFLRNLRIPSTFHEMDIEIEGDNGILENDHPATSSMTDSSNGSGNGSMHDCSSSSLNRSIITIRATYKDETIRFKFDPSAGCFQLYEKVGKKLNLQNGTFQLKYLDDEDEWVMLVSDSDLQECVEVMEYLGTHKVKFLVRDVPCALGSSSGSNCFLPTGK